jgi:hypothetical protein
MKMAIAIAHTNSSKDIFIQGVPIKISPDQ